MDLADNDPTLFLTWLGAGNESNIIEIRQVKKSGAESTWTYIAQYTDDHGVLKTITKTGTASSDSSINGVTLPSVYAPT